MLGRWRDLTLWGIALAAAAVAAFGEWLAFAPVHEPTRADYSRSILLMGSSLIVDRRAPDVFHAVRTVLAVVSVMTALFAIHLFVRAKDSLPVRLLGWILAGNATMAFVLHFLALDGRYEALRLPEAVLTSLLIGGLAWLATLLARFLAVFPRPVDGDSVMRSYWGRRRRHAVGATQETDRWSRWWGILHDPDARSLVLLPWHGALVGGRAVWIAPVLLMAGASGLVLMGRLIPWDGWGGIWLTAIVVVVGWYLLQALPFAFASTTHLLRNGSDDERRRVRWLRAVLLGAALITASVLAIAFGLPFVRPGDSLTLQLSGAVFLYFVLLPTLLVGAISFASLYSGALDARVAVTRVTVWTLLSLAVTLGFLLAERFVAAKVISWLSLPPDSGAIVAGALIAGTFVPLRQGTEAAVTRLAERYLPLELVVEGLRHVRVVMVSDLSGYTALSAIDEPRALLLGALLKRQAEKALATTGGRLVKTMGDAVMTTFENAPSAVAAARELHRAFPEAASIVGLEPLPLHTALHMGEVVEARDGDIYGQTVNVTARLVDAAGIHEIVVSGTVLAAMPSEEAFEPIGERRFKNVPEPVACFRLRSTTREPEASQRTQAEC